MNLKSFRRWLFAVASILIGIGITHSVINRTELVFGQVVGGLFGIGGLWLLERILQAAIIQPAENKGRLIKLIVLKTLFLGALVGVLAGTKIVHPVGFLLGYGCVLLSWALEHWMAVTFTEKK